MTRSSFAVLALLLSVASVPAWAQDAAGVPPSRPLLVERITDSYVIAPEFKITGLDGDAGQLAGVYAARVIDKTLLVGGGVYWLANNERDFALTYGGLLVGWSAPVGPHVRFGARGLTGVGSATLGLDAAPGGGTTASGTLARFGARSTPRAWPSRDIRVAVQDDFIFIEPQADMTLRLNERFGVTLSGGYRLVGLDDVLRDRLNGATGSLGLQVTW